MAENAICSEETQASLAEAKIDLSAVAISSATKEAGQMELAARSRALAILAREEELVAIEQALAEKKCELAIKEKELAELAIRIKELAEMVRECEAREQAVAARKKSLKLAKEEVSKVLKILGKWFPEEERNIEEHHEHIVNIIVEGMIIANLMRNSERTLIKPLSLNTGAIGLRMRVSCH